MKSDATTVKEYLDSLPEDRRKAISAVRREIRKRLPRGYVERMQYGMIGYSVPLRRYPETYNGHPLNLAALASQKNYMSVYLTNVYSDPELQNWFEEEYRATGKRLDMGKSCVRFRRLDDLPVELIGEAVSKTPVDDFIARYEEVRASSSGRRRAKQ
ncbi:MAG: DUF1801 domain-containing protein [Chloroflexi bacterium]|nr:DUF1801 domain-containing protein [Chloroflexota bacterium]MDA1145695.1 DUF1801 domain-containing protein [Chloroflexota bacterium]